MFPLPCLSSLLLKAMQKGSPERRAGAVPGTAAAWPQLHLCRFTALAWGGIAFPFHQHGGRVPREAEILLAVIHIHSTAWDRTRLLFSLTGQQA